MYRVQVGLIFKFNLFLIWFRFRYRLRFRSKREQVKVKVTGEKVKFMVRSGEKVKKG